MNSPHAIFDTALIRRHHDRALKTLSDHNFLIDRAAHALADRLADVKRDFPIAILNSPRASGSAQDAINHTAKTQHIWGWGKHFQADAEFLPFAASSLDLFISNFTLHNTNDLPGALIQIRRALKPDGLFIGAMVGGETLFELRSVLQQAEMEIKGGISPRVHPFASKQDMGALLQRAGFALPV
ncbi:MAG: methyltransferase domain-containing protein, partial [Alphaproteobacteria bacterium]|nr:methyltransferase domain-containing protein [Alphaproteobacteria bacterium]